MQITFIYTAAFFSWYTQMSRIVWLSLDFLCADNLTCRGKWTLQAPLNFSTLIINLFIEQVVIEKKVFDTLHVKRVIEEKNYLHPIVSG